MMQINTKKKKNTYFNLFSKENALKNLYSDCFTIFFFFCFKTISPYTCIFKKNKKKYMKSLGH